MNRELLKKILDDIRSVKIIVVGDFCLDAYWFIDESMSEISLETGEITRPVRRQRYSPGGAGNVVSNLAAMGAGDIRIFGVCGNDPFGSEMTRIMNALGINTQNLVVQNEDWDTHVFAKPCMDDKELNRIDWGNFNRLSDATAGSLISSLAREIPVADIVIINQQVPSGIHTGNFRKKLLGVIESFPGKKFITDSRSFNDYYKGTMRKMNDTEAARLCGQDKNPDEPVSFDEVLKYAETLYERFGKPLFITRGSNGSVTIDESGISEIPGLLILSKVDTVGAGDSYLAGAAAALAAGYSPEIAALTGSFVAGVTVQKLFQTGTAAPEEIMEIGGDPDYIYKPGLADDIRHANYLENTEIEIINKLPDKLRVRHAIFDHDGTISTLREGWELIMAPVMMKAVLGDQYLKADELLYARVSERISEYIDKTTGMQTLAQMKGLTGIVREFGCVPEEKILDENGYKKIYNDELLRMVGLREEKLRQGELEPADFTIKNAVSFLQKLHENGIKLYLASGTDVEDVKHEAEVLGYDHLFEGRIYGAVGDLRKEAKKIVLDQILDMIGGSSSCEIITFGDGPVEMRETKKRNGIAIGVATHELRRYGLNYKKRSRLIKAGADFIIPDFSQYSQLLHLLKIR